MINSRSLLQLTKETEDFLEEETSFNGRYQGFNRYLMIALDSFSNISETCDEQRDGLNSSPINPLKTNHDQRILVDECEQDPDEIDKNLYKWQIFLFLGFIFALVIILFLVLYFL